MTKDDLLVIKKPPKMNEISLQLLQEFYEEFLNEKCFIYELKGLTINLEFHKDNLPHLLGLHHVKANKGRKIKLKGIRTYQEIEKGVLTFAKLKSINKNAFDQIKYRLKYFAFIYQVLTNPSVIKFNNVKLSNCKIDCDFMLYDDFNNCIIHLGVEGDGKRFYPKTFLVESNMGDKFIKDQEMMRIIGKKVVSLTDDFSISTGTDASL